jgi:PBP1b-binding outer membrane lipoprotein LpoB
VKRAQLRLYLAIGSWAVLLACSSAPTVARRDVDEQIDLSGYWNDTDSRLVSEEMVSDALGSSWSGRAASELGRQPRVIVGRVRNRSQEHLDTQTFVKDLERAMVKSGTVDVVAAPDERDDIRRERQDQQTHASIETAKSMGKELGADFMLQGQIHSILDAADNQQLRFYQVELELVDLESNKKVWIGQKKLKKTVTYRKTRF